MVSTRDKVDWRDGREAEKRERVENRESADDESNDQRPWSNKEKSRSSCWREVRGSAEFKGREYGKCDDFQFFYQIMQDHRWKKWETKPKFRKCDWEKIKINSYFFNNGNGIDIEWNMAAHLFVDGMKPIQRQWANWSLYSIRSHRHPLIMLMNR